MNTRTSLCNLGRNLFVAGLIAVLTACGGGNSSSSSDDDTPTSRTALAARSPLYVEVSGVTIASPPVMDFYIEDKNGVMVTDLLASDLQFTIAQLDPGSNGSPSSWQSYININKTAAIGDWPGTEAKIQAGTEKASAGKLVNHGDGTYTYTFATDITNVTAPLAVPYDATRTHRIAMQFGGSVPVTNAIYTWQPSTGATSNIASRDIVRTGSCNECHGKLVFHGGGRVETGLCVTCHAPGRADPESGNTLDFKVLIHKLHRGKNLPSVAAGGSYYIIGHGNSKHDYSDLGLPQDIRNCTKCHDGNDPATPDANNWQYKPSAEACGSCHDDVNFTTGTNHKGGIVNNAMCSDCHSSGGSAGPVAASHTIPAKVASARFAYAITEATYDSTTKAVTAKFKITDPTRSDAPYALTEEVWKTSTLRLNIGWDSSDYSNAGANSGVAKVLQIAFLSAGKPLVATELKPFPSYQYDPATGVHTVTSAALPDGAQTAGSGSVAIEGYPKVDVAGTLTSAPVTSPIAFFAINDATPKARREVVASAKCLQCHETLSLHGNNRVNEVGVCVTCHNANNTDIGQRPVDDLATPEDESVTLDGKVEESIDFKRMIHGIHAADFRADSLVVYGHGKKAFDFGHVRFPGVLNNCKTCHVGKTYALPLSSDASASVTATNVQSTLDDDLVITPTAAACSSCHDTAQTHMEDPARGAMFDADRATTAVATELCVNCHGPGQALDIERVHGID